jgi:hypothetical protein
MFQYYNTIKKVSTLRDISRHDIHHLMQLLTAKIPEYSCIPDVCSVEGGIECKYYNPGIGQTEERYGSVIQYDEYKAVRITRVCCKVDGIWESRVVDFDANESWNQDETIVFQKNDRITLTFKTRYGAPLFTSNELNLWLECFNEIGIIKYGSWPKKT